MPENTSDVFVVRDFDVDRYVGLALQYLSKYPPEGNKLHVPGIPGAPEQGLLMKRILAPAITKAEYVICFVDSPNANVGYELGFALGSGREVALVSINPNLPGWLSQAPTEGYLVATGVGLSKLRSIVEEKHFIKVDPSKLKGTGDGSRRGTDVLFLGPRSGEGAVGHALVQERYPDWRVPEAKGWTLEELPEKLKDVGQVVWLISSFNPGTDERDGQENALNAITAGYAKGVGIEPRILKSENFYRTISDIEDKAIPFEHLQELEDLLETSEEKRGMALAQEVKEAPTPAKKKQLNRIIGTAQQRPKNWFFDSAALMGAVGRIKLHNDMQATCFLVAPDKVLTTAHVAPDTKAIYAAQVHFETHGQTREVTRFLWTSGLGDLDASLLQLGEPIEETEPLRLSTDQVSLGTGANAIVIGHPRGGALSISPSNTAITSVTPRVIWYETATEPGGSGSPVFDGELNLIAMHHAARRETRSGTGTGTGDGQVAENFTIGEGIRIDAIAQAIAEVPSLADLVDQT